MNGNTAISKCICSDFYGYTYKIVCGYIGKNKVFQFNFQVKYYIESHNIYDGLLKVVSPDSTSPEELKQRIDQNLAQIRALSTTVDE